MSAAGVKLMLSMCLHCFNKLPDYYKHSEVLHGAALMFHLLLKCFESLSKHYKCYKGGIVKLEYLVSLYVVKIKQTMCLTKGGSQSESDLQISAQNLQLQII